jgi:FkbM family methyltransferase
MLKKTFQWVVLPIRKGPLKGTRWTIASSLRFIKGTYEKEQVAMFQSCLRSGDVVYDIGAHMGYYALVAAVTVGGRGQVIAFEPHPFNLRQLRRHVRLSQCDNLTVIEACVGDQPGTARFTVNLGSGTNHLDPAGTLNVSVVTLDGLVEAGTIPLPQCIKIDVEGNEFAVLRGAQAVIRKARPSLFISFHGQDIEKQCSDLLQSWGYRPQDGMWRPESAN